MPELETLLRDVRPAPDPAWAARLDARAAAGAPGPPPRWKAPLIAFREHFFAIGALATVASLVAVIVIVGSSVELGSDDEGGGGASSTAAAPSGAGSSEAATDRGSAPQPMSGIAADASPRDRAVISSATLTLSTSPDRVQAVSDRAIRVVDTLGGFVQSSQIDSSRSAASAALALRIPSDKLDTGLSQLSRLANVRGRSQQAEDVTDQRAALEAAVRDARADRDGVRARLRKAVTDSERSKLRAQLDRATRRVTQRQRQVAELGQAVSFATVDLTIVGDRRSGAAPAGDRWTPGDAIGDAVRVLEVIAGVLVIALAVLLPVALLAALAAAASRVIVRRRRERALEMA